MKKTKIPKIAVQTKLSKKSSATLTFTGEVEFDASDPEQVHEVIGKLFDLLRRFHSAEEVQRIGSKLMAELEEAKANVPAG